MTITITTPLYYVNDKPHLGSVYTTIAADALARFYRLKGEEVEFVTGVDEHGQKIQKTALLNNIEPQLHCDGITKKYIETWKNWDISNNRFVRTTSPRHKIIVEDFFNRVKNSGDIYIGHQKGWYCVGCEEYKDIKNKDDTPICDIHTTKLEWRDEENLFFKLSRYQNEIIELISRDCFIFPDSRKNEILNFAQNGLKDFSISRLGLKWGIPVPGYEGHTFYVWFDALLGYISALTEQENIVENDYISNIAWPASIHIIGKDILRFHTIYWPAMLISAGYKIPEKVFAHGFLTREGRKMGKTLGNILDPNLLLNRFSISSVRWYLLRDINFGSDGDFQLSRFIDLVNNDLSNTIGNLLNRTVSMSNKWFGNIIPTPLSSDNSNIELQKKVEINIRYYMQYMSNLNFKMASEEVLKIADLLNIFINDSAPWQLIKKYENKELVSDQIYTVLEYTRIIAILLYPIIPDYSIRILNQLGITKPEGNFSSLLKWGNLLPGTEIPNASPVMTRIDTNLEL